MESHAPTSGRGSVNLLARYADLARVPAGGADLAMDLKVLAGEGAEEPPRELQELPVPGMELRDHLAGGHHEGGEEVDGGVPPVAVGLGGGVTGRSGWVRCAGSAVQRGVRRTIRRFPTRSGDVVRSAESE